MGKFSSYAITIKPDKVSIDNSCDLWFIKWKEKSTSLIDQSGAMFPGSSASQ